jgi:hypothetical protein
LQYEADEAALAQAKRECSAIDLTASPESPTLLHDRASLSGSALKRKLTTDDFDRYQIRLRHRVVDISGLYLGARLGLYQSVEEVVAEQEVVAEEVVAEEVVAEEVVAEEVVAEEVVAEEE